MEKTLSLTRSLFLFSAMAVACQDTGQELNFSQVQGDLGQGKIKVLAAASGLNEQNTIKAATIGVNEVHLRSVSGQWFRFQIEPFVLDIFDLGAGVGEAIARGSTDAGLYDHVRLITEEWGAATLMDDSTIPLRVPSGPTSGLKVFFDTPIGVENGLLTVAQLEFDVSKSFVFTPGGNNIPTDAMLKPVIRTYVTGAMDPGDGNDSGDGMGGDDPNPDPSGSPSPDPSSSPSPGPSPDPSGGPNDDDMTDEDDTDDGNFPPVIGV